MISRLFALSFVLVTFSCMCVAYALPDPAGAPQESASLLWQLYKDGHLIPAIVVGGYFALLLLQRWVSWLRAGQRKVYVAAALATLGMLAERASTGTPPNLQMLMGALGVGLTMLLNTQGDPAKDSAQ